MKPTTNPYRARVIQDKQKQFLMDQINMLQAKGWYGRVEIVFDGGFMKRLYVNESKLPPQS